MAETQSTIAPVGVGYGYTEDNTVVSGNPFVFGLNTGCFLKTFNWIHNGGKDGAEQEALDIVFTINGTDKNYRMFPIIKVFGKNQEEITDPTTTEFKEGMIDFNAKVNHILGCFVDQVALRTAMNRPIKDFKDFCTLATNILPRDFNKQELDIFLQYQWQKGEGKEKTYLEIPKKMKYGRWLNKHIPGNWKEVRKPNPTEQDARALMYVNDEGITHPFIKNGWFMLSHFANQQKPEGSTGGYTGNHTATTQAATAMNAAPANTTQEPTATTGTADTSTETW